jgi:starch phosphorylase
VARGLRRRAAQRLGAVGRVRSDHAAQDFRHAAELYDLLESEVVPQFYARDGGPPTEWLRRVKASIRTVAPQFTCARMLDDYVSRMYRR